MILCLWSFTASRFVSSALGLRIAFMAAFGIGALAGIATYFDPFYAQDTPARAARLVKAPPLENPLVRMLLVGAFMAFVTFYGVNGAALEFWTLATGRPSQLTLHLGAYRSLSRSGCTGFELQEAPLTFRRVVCAHYRYDDVPAPGTAVVLNGTASPFGIDVQSFRILE